MEAYNQSLQSPPRQVIETTLGISSLTMPGMNFRQSRRVTKRGVDHEKTTRTLVEVLLVSVAAICLFLTGCSRPMTDGSVEGRANPIVLNGGEATFPAPPVSSNVQAGASSVPNDIVQPEKPDTSATDDETSAPKLKALKLTMEEDAIQRRVRVVLGWLNFVGQKRTHMIVEAAWKRLEQGKVVGPLRFDPVADIPEISIRELMLWRQLLLTDKVPLTVDMASRMEGLAIALTMADRADDLIHADRYFPAGYGD